MAAIFRSEEMVLCEVYIPLDSVYSVMAYLGEERIVQFTDLNAKRPKNRRFMNELQLCDNLEGKLHYLRLQTKDYSIKLKDVIGNPPAPHPRQLMDMKTHGTADFDLLRKLYNEVKQISYNLSPLERTVALHYEYQAILRTACSLLFQKVESLQDAELGQSFNVHIIGGVLPQSKWMGFERTLWRMCHGNYIIQASDIHSDSSQERRLFVILVHGVKLQEKILKLCQAFSADMYDIPESRSRCSALSRRNKSILADLKTTVAMSKEHYTKLLSLAAMNMTRWLVQIRKMKAIYHTMNMCKLEESDTFLIAECWVPKSSFERFKEILHIQSKAGDSDLDPMVFPVDYRDEKPPTYFKLNSVTKGFQNIINAYGIANYKELNAMPYTVITFPFLFAVMFGDVGHALIIILIGLALIIYENTLRGSRNEILKMIYGGRYIILLMGLFSCYTGFIYNDFFGFYIGYPSKWKILPEHIKLSTYKGVTLDPKTSYTDGSAAIGLDPAWRHATNAIRVQNSLKMKLSVIIGVVHMTFGIFLSLFNMIYFKDYISIVTEFIPQLIFFLALFGYLVFLIILKWLMYGGQYTGERSSYCAPAIIIRFVDMVLGNLGFGSSKKEEMVGCGKHMYPYEYEVEKALIFCALACVPVMFLVKPIYFICRGIPAREKNTLSLTKDLPVLSLSSHSLAVVPSKRSVQNSWAKPWGEEILLGVFSAIWLCTFLSTAFKHILMRPVLYLSDTGVVVRSLQALNESTGKEDTQSIGELLLHQVIHTIEFVLGTVSYTASYLRLWALSLAHANLTDVLNMMVLQRGIHICHILPGPSGAPLLLVIFFLWAMLTVGVLIIMEGLSAFLHALRLHWMEFQSKFYVGQGTPFTPFSFKQIFHIASEDLEKHN